ncbi:MAG: S9 family peptidase [Caldilineaceae bacterium]
MYDFARYLNIRAAHSPALSRSGNRLAFLSDITGNFQVWSIGLQGDAADSWPVQLTFFADKVWELHASPAADQLIAVSDVGGNERQQFYLISNFGVYETGEQNHDVRRLTDNDAAIHRFGAWSKDGAQILYTSNARNNVDFDLYRLDVASGESTRLLETSGNRALVAWSPDGRFALMLDAVATEQLELYLLDLESGQERHVTSGQPNARYMEIKWTDQGVFTVSDRTCDRFALCKLDLESAALNELVRADDLLAAYPGQQGELEALAIAPDGSRAALILNVEGYDHLYWIDLASGGAERVEGMAPGVIGSLKFSPDGAQLLCDFQTPTQNQNVWSVDVATGQTQQLTFSNRAGVDSRTFVGPELIHFTTHDELEIPAFYYLPQSAPPAGGYPCILYVHGGPAGQQRPDFDVRFQYFLNQGYALLVTNVRGSTGYGRRYMMLDDLELRMESVADLKYAVAWLHERDEINSDAIAIYGRSYGGYMVLAALTEYPELFAAGIDVVGIANWVSFMERTSPWRRAHREREYGSLEQQRDLLARISPIHKAERIAAPLLVLAGDNDPRVPLFESEQIVEKVRAGGGVVEFIHYADEGHRFSKLANRVDSFTKMAAFLQKHM